MLTNTEIEQLLAELKTPEAGRQLVRQIRASEPVRPLQQRMDTVRTRYLSAKMDRPVYAESRTVELAAFVWYDADKSVTEFYAQPCTLDLSVSGMKGGRTRVQHTPDAFVVRDGGLFLEEWRQEDRLLRLAEDRPHHFQKDGDGRWHYLPAEEHCRALGITHWLRSSDELPRVFIANVRFLEDYSLESAPLVPDDIATKLMALVAEHKRVPHLELVYKHGFSADHILPLVLDGRLYVDLHNVRCDKVDDLVVYANPLIYRADMAVQATNRFTLPDCSLELRTGSRFVYDRRTYDVVLTGDKDVVVRDEHGDTSSMSLELVKTLHASSLIDAGAGHKTEREYDLDRITANQTQLQAAIERLDALNNRDVSEVPARTLRRWASRVGGAEDAQQMLVGLMCENRGNRRQRLPEMATELALASLKQHNRAAKPTVFSTFNCYVALCDDAGVTAMSRSSFYRWMRHHEDVRKREGKRKEYQKAPIPLTFDYDHPVHGVQPHEVVYCDHTPMNVFLKGMRLENLGKPTLTLMTDGALSMPRALTLLYRPACTASVLMCLRDYARRHGCLPRTLVLDNGKEFHGHELKALCSIFGIDIRWRRRSRPRDSTLVERAIGVTEQELLSSLDGNTIALKNPREVSSAVDPAKFVTWTLPALHGSLEYFLFEVQTKRVHPRFGMTPSDWERRLLLEFGARAHRLVRFDPLFKLLTSPHTKQPTRILDRRKGVFVDGRFYWNDRFATSARKTELVEVRVELWNASVVYVQFNGEWLVAQARDGSRLEGRFNYEVEIQQREESRRQRTAADNDRASPLQAQKKVLLFDPRNWDDRLREQCMEEYHLYAKLGMVEALPEARNLRAAEYELGMPRSSDLALLRSISREPDFANCDHLVCGDNAGPTSAVEAAPAQAELEEDSSDSYF